MLYYGTSTGVNLQLGSIYVRSKIEPVKVIYNGNKTIVFWNDDTKTIVTCGADEEFDTYTGFAMAYVKKMFGSTSATKKMLGKISKDERTKVKKVEPNVKYYFTDEESFYHFLKCTEKEFNREAIPYGYVENSIMYFSEEHNAVLWLSDKERSGEEILWTKTKA